MKFFLSLCLVMSVSAFAQSGADAEESSEPTNTPTSMRTDTMDDSDTMQAEEQRMEVDKKEVEKDKKEMEDSDMSTVPTPAPSTAPSTKTP